MEQSYRYHFQLFIGYFAWKCLLLARSLLLTWWPLNFLFWFPTEPNRTVATIPTHTHTTDETCCKLNFNAQTIEKPASNFNQFTWCHDKWGKIHSNKNKMLFWSRASLIKRLLFLYMHERMCWCMCYTVFGEIFPLRLLQFVLLFI